MDVMWCQRMQLYNPYFLSHMFLNLCSLLKLLWNGAFAVRHLKFWLLHVSFVIISIKMWFLVSQWSFEKDLGSRRLPLSILKSCFMSNVLALLILLLIWYSLLLCLSTVIICIFLNVTRRTPADITVLMTWSAKEHYRTVKPELQCSFSLRFVVLLMVCDVLL